MAMARLKGWEGYIQGKKRNRSLNVREGGNDHKTLGRETRLFKPCPTQTGEGYRGVVDVEEEGGL